MLTVGKVGRASALVVSVVSGTLAAFGAAAPAATSAVAELGRAGAEPAAKVAAGVTLAAAAGLVAMGAWLAASTAWCVVVALRTGVATQAPGLHSRLTPRLVRLVVGAALGTTALAAPAAAASTTPGGAVAHGPPLLPQALAGLPLPDRQPGAARPAAPRATAPAASPRTRAGQPLPTHTVATGDTLWSIAAERLGSEADPGLVERGWRAVYDANRRRIGDDPDLIRPGTTLRVPPALT
jgi:nucleoid-associated protein YgaU